ncbi:MAG: aminoacyl-tRNA hydrolase [Acidimicrobiia bacterium]|nr:aminoacyl-tRNA hydrolase [Acidimicrobiia bacterium]
MESEEYLDLPDDCRIPVSVLEWSFSRPGGPGGQHANTSDTRVQVSLDLNRVELPARQRDKIVEALGEKIRVTVSDTRSQARNRAIAVERLTDRLARALAPVRRRRDTKPSRAAGRRRLEAKRRRAETKRLRGRPED